MYLHDRHCQLNESAQIGSPLPGNYDVDNTPTPPLRRFLHVFRMALFPLSVQRLREDEFS